MRTTRRIMMGKEAGKESEFLLYARLCFFSQPLCFDGHMGRVHLIGADNERLVG